ncbi:MAG: tetratricopeptide repeat protein [Steroidobacteraceae bacterium]|jgi:tetratricopeptide (TPR) repeat protein|nr:tetratricopeptide repeat protein [Steroidobacteraceae bacterium]
MRASPSLLSVVAACALGLAAGQFLAASAVAQQDAAAPAPQFSKGFQKAAGKVQKLVQEQKWAEVIEAMKPLEALDGLTPDDRNVMFSWKLQALRGLGDEAALNAFLEQWLESGYASPAQIGPINQQLAAWYNRQKDGEKTRYHYRKFIEATPDADAQEYETLGRLYFQADDHAEAATWLGKAIATATAAGEKPKELWYQLLDQCFVELNDGGRRLANLEELVKQYPKAEYYSRVLALYAQGSGDDRVVMLHGFRLAMTDTGLETVGQYLTYTDLAISVGSPGEGERALEKGIAAGVVPSAGSNQQLLSEAKAAASRDRRDLAKDAETAAKGTNGEVDAKIGLGFYSIGQHEQAVAAITRGLQKGGVRRVDDANLTLGAALAELGRYDEARAAFAKAAEAAGAGSWMARMAGLWAAYAQRKAGA